MTDALRVRGDRRLDVQGLRAIAILLVVAYHGRFGVGGGFVGVDVFFVISGFVITGTLTREIERAGTIDIAGFYRRRVRRLLPALAVMVTFVVTAGMLLAPVTAIRTSGLTGIAASVFGANWYLYSLPAGYFDPAPSLDPLLHTWTLGVEEQFYLVFPLLLLVAWRLRGRAAAFIAIAVCSSVSLIGAERLGHGRFAFYASPTRAWEFGLGCLVALAVPVTARLPRIVAAVIAAAGATAVAAAAAAAVPGQVTTLLVPVLGAGCVLVAGSRGSMISELLSLRPLTFLGDLSYSWYLWHWPLIVFATAFLPSTAWPARVAAVASIVPAWASYRFVENPIRFSPRLRERSRTAAVAAICIATPALAAALTLQFHVSTAQGTLGSSAFHADVAAGCDRSLPLGSPQRPPCRWTVPNATGNVVLIGDSNAGHFTEPVVAAANELGLDATVATYSACPFVQLNLGGDFRNCELFDRESLRWLVLHPPRLVIIGIRADAWIEQASYTIASTSAPAAKASLWASGLRREIVQLNRAGTAVIVVHPVPIVGSSPQECATLLVLLNRCGSSESRAAVDRELRRTLVAEQASVRGLRAHVLDLEDELCSSSSCGSTRNGLITYRDRQHLSVVGARMLTPVFRREIADYARIATASSGVQPRSTSATASWRSTSVRHARISASWIG